MRYNMIGENDMGTIPIYWWVFAACHTDDIDALANTVHPDAQFEGDGLGGTGCVSVGFLSGAPTMEGVKIEGRAAVKRIFGPLVTDIDVVTLTRDVDSAVFDAEMF
jgi:hypothetical protein